VELYDEDVRAILELLDGSGFDELEVETGRFKLTLRRESAGWTNETRTFGVPREADAARETDAAREAYPSRPAPAAGIAPAVDAPGDSPERGAEGWFAVKTPLPGTFYRSPKPGAPAFVEVGARVLPDTVVAIVETMKLMNSVYAGTEGRVAAISRSDGELVGQHAVLMFVAPDSERAGDPA
jgi:acetyl-CoA carboxylase biotin carboxyl carrier protein